ncbi:MAG: sugar phosphate isomerase/epimerase [Armatimonadetes bacterium]|nr:sugar phosphate isomerase/epimerase [Armatimonadota bacterium]
MWLCLSGRQFEVPGGISQTVDEFLAFAAGVGFAGVELRSGHLSPDTTDAEAERIAARLKGHGLRCSFCLGGEPADDDSAARFRRVIDLAATIDAFSVRCGGASQANVARYRELADYAGERGIRVQSQIHNGTLFETAPDSLRAMELIAHPNYGVAFEASHLVMASQPEHGEEAVKALADHIVTVSVQAYKPYDAFDCYGGPIEIHGRQWGACLPGAPGSPDLLSVFRGLRAIGFDGPVTAMPGALPGGPSPEDQARIYFDTLEPLVRCQP